MSNLTKFTPPHPLNTAVLFLVFNRLDTTKQVFEAIREAKPPRLYIAADGARESKNGEDEKVKEVREYILSYIDWDCEVKTLFREQNYGCKMAVSGAIDWFFENEEMGIILEDDCLPSQSFFWFCEELLERYKDDMRIWHISGTNLQNGIKRDEDDYYFSFYNLVWGWATWKRSWKYYDVEIKKVIEFKRNKLIRNIWCNRSIENSFLSSFDRVKEGTVDTWDYQWTFTILSNYGLSITPQLNMISNLGFGEDATHTKTSSPLSNLNKYEIQNIKKMKHPEFISPNIDADIYIHNRYIKLSFLNRLKNRFYRIIKNV